MDIRSAYFASEMNVCPRRAAFRCFAKIGARTFEFVRLGAEGSQVEAYDYPYKGDDRGCSRFLGYLPADQAWKLVQLATDFARARGGAEWRDREVTA